MLQECQASVMRNNLWKVPLFSALLSFSIATSAQQPGRVLVIEGQTGQAPVVEVGGRAYVEIEGLTQITHGSLTFSADHIVLRLPTSRVNPSVAEPSAELALSPIADDRLSRDFVRAGIEEIATMREWANTLAYAIENGYPISEHWTTKSREAAAHDLRFAAAAISNESDRNAHQLLTNEFEAVRQWSDKLVHERQSMDTAKYAISANALQGDPASQKIIACGHFLAAMLGSGSFKDDPSCH
jgi:hypothetical protein